jgi:hypothetical protein
VTAHAWSAADEARATTPCRDCGAVSGRPCVGVLGEGVAYVHDTRVEAARDFYDGLLSLDLGGLS